MLMQRDGDGEQSKGFKGATLQYRKIQGLELDPLFADFLQRPLFRDICQRAYGPGPVRVSRAMFMNKPAHAARGYPGIRTAGASSTPTR